jgi:hypothetical protein
LSLPKAIDRMEATGVAFVRGVRNRVRGLASLQGRATVSAPVTRNPIEFDAPTEDASAGFSS